MTAKNEHFVVFDLGKLFNPFQYPFILWMWILFLMLFPVYFFKSGNPQISDYFMVLVLGISVANGHFKSIRVFEEVDRYFAWFVVYVFLVNFVMHVFVISSEYKSKAWYIIAAFYIYNYLVIRLLFNLYYNYGGLFLKATFLGLLLSIIITITVGSYMPQDESVRGSLSFQTSNQLGYFSLVAATMAIVLSKVLRVSKWVLITILMSCFYMAAVGISNAAIYSIIILLAVYFIEGGLLNVRRILSGIGIILVGFLGLFFTEFGQSALERYQYRVDTSVKDQSGASEWEYRGYDRIFNHPEYLVLGAGEGAFDRFDTRAVGHELHSSFGTVAFCYGIPGTIIFTLLLLSFFKGLKLSFILYSAPIFAYGVTHMGLRFTIFWIAIALFPILNHFSRVYWTQKTAREKAVLV